MWFFQKNGVSQGPFQAQQIQELIRKGTITGETLVWSDGIGGWTPAEKTVLMGYIAPVTAEVGSVASTLYEPPLPVLSEADHARASGLPAGFRNPTALTNGLTALLAFYLLIDAGLLGTQAVQINLVNAHLSGQTIPQDIVAVCVMLTRVLAYAHTGVFVLLVLVFCRWVYTAAQNVLRLGAWA